ncbi:MAG: hypothetical protein HYW15_02345 [Candidatus Giovannonibacteria bacterium]|nr:MAG: hypothetical protein HYW15_02345 [Candidatus Giovannonibacteria bacterium]
MKILLHEDIPRWYSFEWQDKPPRILVSIHKRFLEHLRPYPDGDSTIEHLKEEFGFTKFDWSFRKGFGFDDAIRLVKDEEFKVFEARLPKVFQLTDKVCRNCEGTGRDELRGGKCLYCEGKKKEHDYVWTPAFAVSCSLNLFLDSAYYFQESSGTPKKQLLCVQLHTAHGMHGGELSGVYSPSLVEWLRAHRGRIPEMEDAMRRAYVRMLRADYLDNLSFIASVENDKGWLNVSCPGSACGLHPTDHFMRDGYGFQFSSHNVDTPAQQLTLLAGLAALYNKVDQDLKAGR